MFRKRFNILKSVSLGVEQDLAIGDIQSVLDETNSEMSVNQLPPDWIEERFRVDRRKLEEMILGKLKHFKKERIIEQAEMQKNCQVKKNKTFLMPTQ